MKRTPRILRISAIPKINDDERKELARIFGRGVLFDIPYKNQSLAELIAIVDTENPSAVILQVPTAMIEARKFRAAIEPIPVLRHMYVPAPVYRDGPAPRKFVGFGRVNEKGELQPLANGELAPSS